MKDKKQSRTPAPARKPKIPTPPPYPVVLAELKLEDRKNVTAKQEAEDTHPPEVVAELSRRTREAFDAFALYASLWSGLTEESPSIYGTTTDGYHLVRVEKLTTVLSKELAALAHDMQMTLAFERAVEIEKATPGSLPDINAKVNAHRKALSDARYNSAEGTHENGHGYFRKLHVGDLVSVTDDPTIAQVTAVDGDHVILAPLIDTETDEAYDEDERMSRRASELRLVPEPPLFLPWIRRDMSQQPVSTEHRRHLAREWLRRTVTTADYRRIDENQAENAEGQRTTVMAVEVTQARLVDAVNLFHQFSSQWEDVLTESLPHTIDHMNAASVNRIVEAMDWELQEMCNTLHCAVAGEREGEREKKRLWTHTPSLDAAAGLRNVMRFVEDVQALRHRAWLYSNQWTAMASEAEIMLPFDTVLQNVLGKVVSQFIAPAVLRRDEIVATELLAGALAKMPDRQDIDKGDK